MEILPQVHIKNCNNMFMEQFLKQIANKNKNKSDIDMKHFEDRCLKFLNHISQLNKRKIRAYQLLLRNQELH